MNRGQFQLSGKSLAWCLRGELSMSSGESLTVRTIILIVHVLALLIHRFISFLCLKYINETNSISVLFGDMENPSLEPQASESGIDRDKNRTRIDSKAHNINQLHL